jgi:DNA repair protein RadC
MMAVSQLTMFSQPRLKRLADDQTPVYRITHLGAKACSFQELIAALVGGSTQIEVAAAITDRWKTPLELLSASQAEIAAIHGVGPARAARIKAAFELGRLAATGAVRQRPGISSPSEVAALVQYEMSALEQEEIRVILLNTRHRVLDIVTVYRGSLNSSQVRVGELFRDAIRQNAAALVVVHNHPSGDPTPSPEDVAVTREVVRAGRLMDIAVLDHLVIGKGRYVSLKERGLGFE